MVALPTQHSPTIAAIDAAVAAAEIRDFDHVVRGSSIGHPCERHLFYRYRWAHQPELFSGQKLRLFHTGHAEEARMIAWLGLAGVTVQAVDPDTNEQWEIVALDGHFKGHLDGIATGILEAPATKHLLECKTHNSRSFGQLLKCRAAGSGVAMSHPEHVAQMQIYMHLAGLTRAFYLAKNKETDELYAERVKHDPVVGMALVAKAERVRSANQAPVKISDDPDSRACNRYGSQCASAPICHYGDWALRNCRTCLQSSPAPDGDWWCARHSKTLSIADQRGGCPNHLYLPSLVPGSQIDADEQAETVTYAMPDGNQFIDGARA